MDLLVLILRLIDNDDIPTDIYITISLYIEAGL